MDLSERRRFIRHPVSVPLDYRLLAGAGRCLREVSTNLGVGGIAFSSPVPLPAGAGIEIHLRWTRPGFRAEGVVVRSDPSPGGYEIGVAFTSGEIWFRARLVAQICLIEQWRREEVQAGRSLTFDEAARRWIEAHAAAFAPADEG